MLIWSVMPLKKVDKIMFGMMRNEVRKMIALPFTEFRKTKSSETTVDNYGVCHVYYNTNDLCIAIEIFDDCKILYNNQMVFPGSMEKIKNIFGSFVENGDYYINQKLSIGCYAPNGIVESILFGEKDYYLM